jgi:hypothetical protein
MANGRVGPQILKARSERPAMDVVGAFSVGLAQQGRPIPVKRALYRVGYRQDQSAVVESLVSIGLRQVLC